MPKFGVPFTGAASFFIGLQQVLWSLIPLLPYEPNLRKSLFVQVMDATNTSSSWLAIMLLSGLYLCVTSFMLNRSKRHVALALSSMVCLATFGLFVRANAVTPVSASLPLMGAYLAFLLWLDVFNKNKRRGCGYGDV